MRLGKAPELWRAQLRNKKASLQLLQRGFIYLASVKTKAVQLVVKHTRVPTTILPFGHTDLGGGTSSPIATMLDRILR